VSAVVLLGCVGVGGGADLLIGELQGGWCSLLLGKVSQSRYTVLYHLHLAMEYRASFRLLFAGYNYTE